MPAFQPFPALRYDGARFLPADVTSPPYDVLSPADRTALVARSPHNAVLIDSPSEDEGPGRYDAAGARLRAWRDEGVLVQDDRPTFTAYRMSSVDERGVAMSTLGVLGALRLSRPEEGRILPHEHTTKKAKSDRLDLLRGTRANLSAIWALSLTAGLTRLIGADGPADHVWTDDAGVTHETWRISDPDAIAAISDAVDGTPLVIADGHHRYETSLAYRDERLASEGEAGLADSALVYVVELSSDELAVKAIHRLVDGLNDRHLADQLTDLGGFERAGTAEASTVASGAVLGMLDELGAIAVVERDGSARLLAVDAGAPLFDGLDDLDSSRLARALEVLGAHEVRYQHGADRVQAAVTAGDASWGVLIRPVTVDAIAENARVGRRMPPKSTFFHPKPRTGVVFRLLD